MGALIVKRILGVTLALLCVLLICGGVFRYLRPTHYAYNDRFILGNTKEAIITRYGEFTREYTDNTDALIKAEYQIRDNTPELVMSYDNSLWYEIFFHDGVAVKVALREGYIGG